MLKDAVRVGVLGGMLSGIVYMIGRLDGRIEMSKMVKEVIAKAEEK